MLAILQYACRFLGIAGLTTAILLGLPFSIVMGAALAGMNYWHGPPPPVSAELTALKIKCALQVGGIVVVPGIVISSMLMLFGYWKVASNSLGVMKSSESKGVEVNLAS